MIRTAARILAGLASSDPFKRIATLERITEKLLWRQPREAIDRHLEIPPPLPRAAIEGARIHADRVAMLSAIPTGGEMVEVGVLRGEFSAAICASLRPRMLHLVDIDFSKFDRAGVTCEFVEHQGDSSTIVGGFPPASIDWAYIDGDHSHDGVQKDLAAMHRALKPGGLITCNDYTNWMSFAVAPYGVARAVNEFVIAEGYCVEGLALAPGGNHDLLIRKPD